MNGSPILTPQQTPCTWCCWYGGPGAHVSYCRCTNPACSRVKAMPDTGCCSWERETGADDDAGRALLRLVPATPLSGG